MIRKLILTLALLLLAAPAWALEFGFNEIGDFTRNFTTTDSTVASRGGSTTSLRLVVTLGDRLDSAMFYLARGGGVDDSVGVAIYASQSFNVDEIIWMDTLVVGAAGWYSTGAFNMPFPYLPHGYSITLAIFAINDLGTSIYYDVGSSGDGVSDTLKAPDPWGSQAPLSTNKYSFRGFYTNTLSYDWGGPKLRDPDSLNLTYLQSDVGADELKNYGASILVSMRTDGTSGSGASATRTMLLKLVNDPRTGGSTQDSIRFYVSLNSALLTGDDSLGVDIFALNKIFGEGAGATGGSPGAAGEATWDSARQGTQAWTSQAGATSSSDHNPTTALTRWWFGQGQGSVNGDEGILIDGFTWMYITIPTPPAGVFDSGLVFVPEENRNGVTFATQNIHADNNSNQLLRPYVIGWQSIDVLDTCSVDHALTAIDTATSTVVVRNNYDFDGAVMDSLAMIWDDDGSPVDPIGRASTTSGITDPDTLTATGLTNCAQYYFWWIAYPRGDCNPDTSTSITVTTDCLAAVRRLILGS